MDPIARRFMWDIISRMTTTDRECSVILTTHSMEEAESLCNNIGIMVRSPIVSCFLVRVLFLSETGSSVSVRARAASR